MWGDVGVKEIMKKIMKWFNTAAGKITIILLIVGVILLSLSFLPIFKESCHIKDNFENIIIGIGTNIIGIIVTVSFVQHILDSQDEKKAKELEKEKISRYTQVLNIYIKNYKSHIAQLTCSKENYQKEKKFEINRDFKFEDMKDLYFPCLDLSQGYESIVSVFYKTEKKIVNFMISMVQNIDFEFYPELKNNLLTFTSFSEANDVSKGILDYENKTAGGKKLADDISRLIGQNNTENWVDRYFEGDKMVSNCIFPHIVLFKLLKKELECIDAYEQLIEHL